MDDLERQQRELMKNATPAQKAQLRTQNQIIKYQLENPPVELPIDQDAKNELKSEHAKPEKGPGKGGKKSRRSKSKKSKKRMTRRRR